MFRFPAFLLAIAVFTSSANAHMCSEEFQSAIEKFNLTGTFCRRKILGAQTGWRFNAKTRQLDMAFGARLPSEDPGWLAWGLNSAEPRMVGTQALIGIKLSNGSLQKHGYAISEETKLSCRLIPVADAGLGLGVRSFDFKYIEEIDYYVVIATMVLPHNYDPSKANVVWQIGYAADKDSPLMHPNSLKHLSTAETVDLTTGEVLTHSAHLRRALVTVHGTLNIVGWGTLLPMGVIISRYLKRYPKELKQWFKLHIGFQICGFVIGATGWSVGIWLGNTSKYYSFPLHRTLGIIIFTFMTIQIVALWLRAREDDPFRSYWNMYHHTLGYSLLVMIWVNIFIGIRIVEKVPAWKWACVGVLGAVGTLLLLFEAFTWIKFLLDRAGVPPPRKIIS
ncbi:cytochrome b561 and DOMON domain-containing protein At5g35735-like isoform X2 [Andrographis paniculata]|uniref:cytochrome b561 and DOMON domain-containing protein At5g35735-like isoform X2 n=1 Tax=Andrographis paniculata TaxID=175694 RepID=UPI0021E7682E|nr:cytochrome b561 and DOMON domain-containing protein At5g35735-like isoform X2 [Andrographis paniculata]